MASNPPDEHPTGPPPAADPSADLGPNPVIGTPRLPRIEPPPAVIHALGDARPGEANPAGSLETPYSQPDTASTADILAAREDAEESTAAGRVSAGMAPGNLSYEDSGANVTPREEQSDRSTDLNSITDRSPMDYRAAPRGYDSTFGAMESLDPIEARLDAKAEANANAAERASSVSGLNLREGDEYEIREFEVPRPERDDVMVGADSGMRLVDAGPAVQSGPPDHQQSRIGSPASSGLADTGNTVPDDPEGQG